MLNLKRFSSLLILLSTLFITGMETDNVRGDEGAASAHVDFDWSAWQRIPVLDEGRIKPIDTFAEEVVTLVTGRAKWEDPESGIKYKAPELFYAWIADPEEWLNRKILSCSFRPLRNILNTENSVLEEKGTYVSVRDLMDWDKSMEQGKPVFWSEDFQQRIRDLDTASKQEKQPDQVGDTVEDRRINAKVAELYKHLQTFLTVREARNLYIVPGLDPRTVTAALNPDDRLKHWVSLGAFLNREDWATHPDVTVAALMADSVVPNEEEGQQSLLSWVVEMGGVYPPAHFPQLAKAHASREEVLVGVKDLEESFNATRTAYDANDANEFSKAMINFEQEVRRLAGVMEEKRVELTPPEAKSMDFGLFNDQIWNIYQPLEIDQSVIASSAYPAEGSTNWEMKYNKSQPFRSAWIYFLVAIIITVLSMMVRKERLVYTLALITTIGAIVYSTWGFFLRIVISGRPPVTNMYETVVWVSYVVAILGLWFCLLPFLWPGLKKSWDATRLPFSFRKSTPEQKESKTDSSMSIFRAIALLLQVTGFVGIVWFLTNSNTTFKIIDLYPPIFNHVFSFGELGVWITGISTVLLSAWYFPRAVIALVGGLITVPASFKSWNDQTWTQAFDRRFFLLGALPVACLGMMLAYFVGVRSPDILNPRIGSIAAVLRNNYWLTIHVLTIVSSYGAGALAWGLGNLALLYYLVGSYRKPGTATAGAPKESFSSRMKQAKKAMNPSVVAASLKKNVTGFGSGDKHLETSKRRPPQEVSTLANYTYKAMQVAVLLLAAGTILGGLWADVSWGRFWDWDPKEVWALISLLVYLVVLHGRFAGWVGTLGTNIGGVLCFNAILMSWYGVNFVLPQIHGWLTGSNAPTAVGLHSYATGAGGLEYVIAAVLLNLLLVVAAGSRYFMETHLLDSGSAAAVPPSPEEEKPELETTSK
ncbi:Cytochrome c biogenesis protein CcsA [Polystyrenella longa]|uniref:Cytochrome c biogenesis protein CcsA n=1 Tax=Polystyrenella longa TaxID=2528007 RepID=A0A518CR46_9PLAN|nr:cytochrome c biogenesis protein CcsA [Polystyrenella longa]QDU81701.1 Cytochrome c biogenesis protein CcsA [Polystyrenella longa]